METKQFFIRVCFQNKMKFVKLNQNEITWKTFVDKGKKGKR